MLKTPEIGPPRYSDVSIKHNAAARMRDGTQLYADIYKPDTKDPLPVLLMRTPYDKRLAQTCVYLDPAWYARYGYMVVVQDCRGRFASEGTFYPYQHETDDGFDTISWASSLPGANGDVGMYGFSYSGAVQLLAASAQHQALKTIAPALTGSDFFNGWTYERGAFSQAFIQSWTIFLAQSTALVAADMSAAKQLGQLAMQLPQLYWSTPLSDIPEVLNKYAPYYADWLEHDCYDDYWKKVAIRERYDQISIPILHISGWYDVFNLGSMKNFIELNRRWKEQYDKSRDRQQKLIAGPWYHVPWQSQFGSSDFGANASNIVNAAQIQWFDQHLRKQQKHSKEQQDISVFVLGSNKWQHLSDWPPVYADSTAYYLHSNGSANSLSGDGYLSAESPADEPWDSYIYDPSFPVPSLGGHSCCYDLIAPMGPRDQRPNQFRNDVLVYTTDSLSTDITIMGQITLKLFASSTAPDTDFTVTVSDVYECGKAINIVNSILRASRRESLIHPKNIEPGEIYEFNIKVGWTAVQFKKGHRIRLEVSSSNFPHFSRNANNGADAGNADIADWVPARQTIFHDSRYPSHLSLPVVST